MKLETKDYGLQAYLILKYDATVTNNIAVLTVDKTILEIKMEYRESDYSIYNEILKTIIKGE